MEVRTKALCGRVGELFKKGLLGVDIVIAFYYCHLFREMIRPTALIWVLRSGLFFMLLVMRSVLRILPFCGSIITCG
jgi:hypothetical protein